MQHFFSSRIIPTDTLSLSPCYAHVKRMLSPLTRPNLCVNAKISWVICRTFQSDACNKHENGHSESVDDFQGEMSSVHLEEVSVYVTLPRQRIRYPRPLSSFHFFSGTH